MTPMLTCQPDHPALAVLPDFPTAQQIEALEAAMIEMERESGAIDFKLAPHHAGGVYARRITIPEGVCVTGARHKHEHLSIINGDVSVWVEGKVTRYTGFHVIRSEPGARRVAFAHAQTDWVAIHANPTGEVDPLRLAELMVEDASRLGEFKHKIGGTP